MRPLILLLAAALPLGAQPAAVVTTKWDIHLSQVRWREAGDSLHWQFGMARRINGKQFALMDSTRFGAVVLPLDRDWIVDARVAASDVRWSRAYRGIAIGAVVAAAAVVTSALTCNDRHSDGPPCGIVIVAAPPAAFAGGIIGGVVGAALPVPPWQRVRLVR